MMEIDDLNIIGFCSYKENNQQWYGCRGIGENYNDFYNWLNQISITNRVDFPWHYFLFSNQKDEKYFILNYIDKFGVDVQ